MKKAAILLLLILSLDAFSQQMSFTNGQVYLDGVKITPKIAKQKSMSVSVDAYISFRKAQSIRGWNVFWGICGGTQLYIGSAVLALDTTPYLPFVYRKFVLGGVYTGIIPLRARKRKMRIADGVKQYNSALGGVYTGIIPLRARKRKMRIADGVKQYNSALQE
jgi:hypothetical protein